MLHLLDYCSYFYSLYKNENFFTFKLGWDIITYCYENMSVVCCFRKWPYKGVLTGKELPPNP